MTIATETSILKHAMGYAARQLESAAADLLILRDKIEDNPANLPTKEATAMLMRLGFCVVPRVKLEDAIGVIEADAKADHEDADTGRRLTALAVENRERLAREDAAHLASLRAAESDRLERLAYERLAYERGAAAVAALSDEPVVLTYGNEVQKFAAYVLQAIAHTNTEGQAPQQVLKAEGESPDATDRETPATASPHVGATGAGQAADAAPAEEPTPAPPTALQTLAAEARSSRFPSRPKMGEDWWDRFYALADEAAA